MDKLNNYLEEIQLKEEEETKKPLNKPFRLPSGSKKKFGVYVKNDKGNVVKVTFGDPNLEIKRDDPKRLKSFRARHGCDNPGPKWKAKYWSCKFWEKGISVTQLLNKEETSVSEAGFEDKPEGWTDKSIKKYSKTFTSKMKGNIKSKDFFDKCVKKMQGKVDNPEGFCASLKDEAYGSTYWRGKDKSKKEVKKDVKQHQNV
jgi:hypothetical protein